ncbi:hypothetical protein GCM10010451_17760 [Streptomyces virens]|uniref:Uncharacterized protein n=1 Tax=Streptomyces virens TaxID=285572 RepID=A0ABP6P762_9ACTN|nr:MULTISPECIES: hypothetical protein [Streptomyces]MBA8978651.1 glutathione S-transferase [Streptomyces calvus]MYS26033.1 hypothetical protein [Streptomyces sp. SID7804]
MTEATKAAKAYATDLDRGLRSVEEAVRVVQRAHDEIARCDQLLSRAQESGRKTAGELGVLLRTRSHTGVPAILDRLDALAAQVARSETDRVLVRRILHGEADGVADARHAPVVPRLTEQDLPRIPSVYDADDTQYETLQDVWESDHALTEEQHGITQQRIQTTADHLRMVVSRAVDSFGTPSAAEALLAEARRACTLWTSCVR